MRTRLGGSILFFFSSRRRHTRWTGDWSSDVCSSDLFPLNGLRRPRWLLDPRCSLRTPVVDNSRIPSVAGYFLTLRSEETRLNSSHPSISYAVFCLKKKNSIELSVDRQWSVIRADVTS